MLKIISHEIEENKNGISSNGDDIYSLQSRTAALEGNTNQDDYYFKYSALGYVIRKLVPFCSSHRSIPIFFGTERHGT